MGTRIVLATIVSYLSIVATIESHICLYVYSGTEVSRLSIVATVFSYLYVYSGTVVFCLSCKSPTAHVCIVGRHMGVGVRVHCARAMILLSWWLASAAPLCRRGPLHTAGAPCAWPRLARRWLGGPACRRVPPPPGPLASSTSMPPPRRPHALPFPAHT